MDESLQVCYAVEIPQSFTAHQARALRYYRRYNFELVPMLDHEIEDVKNRRKSPRLEVKLSVKWMMDVRLLLAVRVWNRGSITPERYGASVLMPSIFEGTKIIHEDAHLLVKDGRNYWRVFVEGRIPVFPTLDTVTETKFKCLLRDQGNVPEPPGNKVFCTLYADDMPPVPHEIPATITKDWA